MHARGGSHAAPPPAAAAWESMPPGPARDRAWSVWCLADMRRRGCSPAVCSIFAVSNGIVVSQLSLYVEPARPRLRWADVDD
jgi:hypothetical protein